MTQYIPDRGDIVWLNFNPQSGREQKGMRPALVVSSKAYNKIGLGLFCPITSKIKNYPFEIKIQAKNIDGVVLADHIKNLDWRSRKAKFIAKADNETIEEVQRFILALVVN